jgi:hypothetical protein
MVHAAQMHHCSAPRILAFAEDVIELMSASGTKRTFESR